MKLRTVSGRFEVSLTHVPGRGSGTREFNTGSHAEFDDDCSLNLPAKGERVRGRKYSISCRFIYGFNMLSIRFSGATKLLNLQPQSVSCSLYLCVCVWE